jgi:hypothetical protein
MTHRSAAQIAERKAQLETRAALERIRITLALHSLRSRVMPSASERDSALFRPLLPIVVGFAAKRIGPAKLRRLLRIASFALAGYRILRTLRR